MANEVRKPKTSSRRKMKYCTFSAMPAEIDAYKAAAKKADRSASWWIRNILNAAVAPPAEVKVREDIQ